MEPWAQNGMGSERGQEALLPEEPLGRSTDVVGQASAGTPAPPTPAPKFRDPRTKGGFAGGALVLGERAPEASAKPLLPRCWTAAAREGRARCVCISVRVVCICGVRVFVCVVCVWYVCVCAEQCVHETARMVSRHLPPSPVSRTRLTASLR